MSEDKRSVAQARLEQAYDQATREFYTAIQLDPDLSEAYGGLGAVMLSLDYLKDALKIYADGLRVAPQDDELFRGWIASLLALDMIDDTMRGYSTLAETNPRRAHILMEQMRASLQARLERPEDFDPSRTESLARWLAEQGG
jgi:tetratricopeptide (TPR) repeat protein